MSLHPDADALIAAFLDRPADETPRLVLADWLDDTGRPEDAVWAAYIRARSAAARHEDGSRERNAALREAAAHAAGITARLTVPAARFVVHPPAFLDLLPADGLTVSLAGCVIPTAVFEVVPESVARSCRVVSLSEWGRIQYVACADPTDRGLNQQLEFILNRPVVGLRADAAEIDAVIETQYPVTESVTAELLTVFDAVGIFPPPTPGVDPPITPMVNTIITDAIRTGAAWVEFDPGPRSTALRHLFQPVWVDRDVIPRRLYPAVVARLAAMAEIAHDPAAPAAGQGTIRVATPVGRATFLVVIEPTPRGPWVCLERVREPAAPGDRP